MKKITLEQVFKSIDKTLESRFSKKSFHNLTSSHCDIVYESPNYRAMYLENYLDSLPEKQLECLTEVLNEESKTYFSTYYKGNFFGFSSSGERDYFYITLSKDEIENILAHTDFKDTKIEKLLDKDLEYSGDSSYFGKEYAFFEVETIKIVSINNDGTIECEFNGKHAEIEESVYIKYHNERRKCCSELYNKVIDELSHYVDEEELKNITNKADEKLEDLASNSNWESSAFEYYCDKYEVDRSSDYTFCDDFEWAKEFKRLDSIIDIDSLKDIEELENKINKTIEEHSLDEIENAKDFIIFQGGEMLYDYIIQKYNELNA